MPHVGEELHRRRRERVVLGELELGGKHAALERRALGALDQAFPAEQVVLGDGAGGDALGRVVGEGAVFLEEAAVGGGLRHGEAGGEDLSRSIKSKKLRTKEVDWMREFRVQR